MLDLATVAARLLLGVPFGLVGLYGITRWLAKRRNRQQLCGHCAGSLYASGSRDGPALLEGIHICSPCAAKNATRLGRILRILAGLTLISAGSGIAMAVVMGVTWWAASLLGMVPSAVLYGGTLAWMKRANRKRAAELTAAGEIWAPLLCTPTVASVARTTAETGT
jgi:hypothetical protein